jgi:hypothetical protein
LTTAVLVPAAVHPARAATLGVPAAGRGFRNLPGRRAKVDGSSDFGGATGASFNCAPGGGAVCAVERRAWPGQTGRPGRALPGAPPRPPAALKNAAPPARRRPPPRYAAGVTIASLRIGQRVRHPACGTGTIKALTEGLATVAFDDGTRRELDPALGGLVPAEPQAAVTGLELPLTDVIRQAVTAVADRLGLERPDAARAELAARWHGGRCVLHPADPALQTKEVPLDVFFHKIVMMRNNLRTLEQKINASDRLTDAEKFDWQGHLTRCYGSMTTFNVLFRDKAGQFSSRGGED